MMKMSSALLLLCPAALLWAELPTFVPLQPTGIYKVGEAAGWRVTAPPASGSDSATASTYTYTIRRNNLDTIKEGSLDLSKGTATIETVLQEPAMIRVEVKSSVAGEKPVHLGAAIAPWDLKPSVKRPADFDKFWNDKLKALAKVPINPVLTPIDSPKPDVELYTLQLNSLGSTVQAYVAKPARPGKFPALMIYQWAGVYALSPNTAVQRASEGWLVVNVSSHDMPLKETAGVPRNYGAVGNTDRETSYFLNMYLRDTRAVDYVLTRPDWDGKTIVASGTSMGGQQSFVAAGLHPKISAVIVNEPAGADSNGDLHGRKQGYPNWNSKDPKVMNTGLYFDIVNFAPRIKAPVAAAIGFIDTVTPPVGIWIAMNQLNGPKEAIPMIESDHNNLTPTKQEAFHSRSKELLETLRTGGQVKLQESWRSQRATAAAGGQH